MLGVATGEFITPDRITPEMIDEATRQIRGAAARNTGRTDWDFLGLSGGSFMDAEQDILPEFNIDDLVKALQENNRLQAEVVTASQQTAANTSGRPPNFSSGLQAGAASASAP